MKELVKSGSFILMVLFGSLFLVANLQSEPKSKTATQSSKKAKASSPGGIPPILDRELFFGNPEIAGAQLSPDGHYIAFLKPWNNTRNIWVKKTSEPFAAAKLVTAEKKRPIPGFFWTHDSQNILFVQDKDGDENYNVYAVNPAEPPAAGQDAPMARNLTDAKGARAIIYSVPKKDPDTIFIGLNDRDAAWHDVYRVTISTGTRTLLRKNTEKIAGWVFDLAGNLRLAVRTTDNGATEILRIDASGFTKVYSCSVFESAGPVRFHKDGRRVYMETNKGDDINLVRLILFDPDTQKEELVESDPLKLVDFGNAIFSEDKEELVATSYEDDRMRIYFRDPGYKANYQLLKKKLPGKEINLSSSTADDKLFLVSAISDTEPGETYLFDRSTKKLTLQYKVRERIPREHLATMKTIHYPSSDGLDIPAYVTLPKGVPEKRLPMILLPHGGPWARDGWGYSGFVQFLANRGYTVLQPNFRGSTGYGKKFLNAGNKQWGDKMQDDLTWGVKYLVAQGTVDPKRVGIMGGSYGGYATLAGVAFTPEVYAAAVSIVGPSNLITLLETIPPYWEAGRIIFYERMGNPTVPEGKKQLERQSPLNSAQKIKTPLLVVQGANDPRVKKAESDQIVIALRDRGFPVEYLVAPDEGHGFARPINNMAMFASAEKFLSKYLNARYQEEMPADVSTRLKEISVDPKTVVLAKKIDVSSVGVPKITRDLRPGTAKYQGKIEVGGQTIPISSTRVIQEDGEKWLVTETAKLPMGEIVDTAWLQKGTLILIKRAVKQGPVEINVEFKDGKANGTMTMNGQPKPVNTDLGGPLFADGAGAQDVLAVLPLNETYTATFRNFDLMKQKPALKQLKVAGNEEVTVAGKTYKTWKVEITSAEGNPGQQTLWIAVDSLMTIKSKSTLPEMGGAVVTVELQP